MNYHSLSEKRGHMLEHPSISYAERYGVRRSTRCSASVHDNGQSAGKFLRELLRDLHAADPEQFRIMIKSDPYGDIGECVARSLKNKRCQYGTRGYRAPATSVRVLPHQQRNVRVRQCTSYELLRKQTLIYSYTRILILKFRPARMV